MNKKPIKKSTIFNLLKKIKVINLGSEKIELCNSNNRFLDKDIISYSMLISVTILILFYSWREGALKTDHSQNNFLNTYIIIRPRRGIFIHVFKYIFRVIFGPYLKYMLIYFLAPDHSGPILDHFGQFLKIIIFMFVGNHVPYQYMG